jgi:hypothetical protein
MSDVFSISAADLRSVESFAINNYRFRNGVVVGVSTVYVAGNASELLPFVTTVTATITRKGQELIKNQILASKNASIKNDDFTYSGDSRESVFERETNIDDIELPTEFYQLRNPNNEVMFITDSRGVASLYGEDALADVKN